MSHTLCIREGNLFCYVFDEDAIILNYLFGYKLKNQQVGFPRNSLEKIVSILEDVSLKKQIFITTHNPYIIKEANLNDILLVSRNETGISTISKPANDEKIKRFLENDLGIEDLFVDGILKWLSSIIFLLKA